MASILTNTGAMTALQTLRGINKGMAQTQDQISTGKRVATAKDNASSFAISTIMKSDVAGFKAISESLSLGDATLGVARQGAETVAELLTEMKSRIVAAQSENVDRTKIQADVESLRNQIVDTVNASQFNGTNLLKSGDAFEVLSSLNRNTSGVASSDISVNRNSLEVNSGNDPFASVFLGTAGDFKEADGAYESQIFPTGTGAAAEDTVVFTFDNAAFNNDASSVKAGDTINISIGDTAISYTITESDLAPETGVAADDQFARQAKVIAGIEAAFNAAAPAGFTFTETTAAASGTAGVWTLTNTGTEFADVKVSVGGGMSGLASIDVSDAAGAASALDAIEGLIQTATDAAANFGSAQKRIETQSTFVSKMTDSLNTGIGAIVDADLEEVSARLQALQVQQQLGVQSLSIANQAPQSILSLFR
jgi:flagellin